MNLRDLNAMPPLGSKQVDATGSAIVRSWILGLQ